MSKVYVWNLVTIIAAGVLVSGWLLFYTDWFEVVGGLLALTGIFTWVAFVSKLIPEERFKDLQKKVDENVLGGANTWAWALLVLFVLLLIAACFGTLELKTRPRAGEYLVDVRRAGDNRAEKVDELVTVPAGGSSRTVRPAFWDRLVVHVKGYPPVAVTISPLRRKTLVVPDSFTAPVVLLRPTPGLIDASVDKKNNKTLQVMVTDGRGRAVGTYTMRFDGTAVWVGCDDDVEVPAGLYEAWRNELAAAQRPTYFRRWVRPQSLFRNSQEAQARPTLPPLRLAPGQALTVTLFKDDTKSEQFAAPVEVPVETRLRWEDFPQVKDLDWK